jgi:toxin YoeB
MIYDIIFTNDAKQDIKNLLRNDPQAYKKLVKLLAELIGHPETGTGHPKPLSADRVGQWSRRITQKHRLIYEIDEKQIVVLVISAFGHYDDK